MLALLEHLAAKHVYVLGLSWGGQLAVNLAAALQEKGMLRGVAPIGSLYWETKTQSYMKQTGLSRLAIQMVAVPAIMRPLAYFMIKPMISSFADIEKMTIQQYGEEKGKAEVECLKRTFGNDLKLFGDGLQRSMSFFLHQNWEVTSTCVIREVNQHCDLQAFDSSVPFHIWLGDKDDQILRSSQDIVKAEVKHAVLKEFEGYHAAFPLPDVIKGLFEGKL